MPIYDYRCPAGHRFECLAPLSDSAARACPGCGEQAPKVPSRISLGGTAETGRSREMMPQTWRGTGDADREQVYELRKEWSRRDRLEQKYPELRGDRRPVLAHEGRFENEPLRAGDAVPAASPAAGHGHAHGHAPGRSAPPAGGSSS